MRNLYAGQEATVRTGHGMTDWFQIGKGVHQGCILSPCLFNFYAECIMRNAGLEEAQAGIKIAGRNINNLRKEELGFHRKARTDGSETVSPSAFLLPEAESRGVSPVSAAPGSGDARPAPPCAHTRGGSGLPRAAAARPRWPLPSSCHRCNVRAAHSPAPGPMQEV